MAKRSAAGGRHEGRILPRAAVERLIRRAGADRVGASASEALAEVLESAGLSLASRATTIAKHAGRKTVTSSDIEIAKS
ncbi:Archaeal histone A [Candidatus Burarchaeum australiense]|nr:Archaeal histone A [Candidatus Burarchaeum australiense]